MDHKAKMPSWEKVHLGDVIWQGPKYIRGGEKNININTDRGSSGLENNFLTLKKKHY